MADTILWVVGDRGAGSTLRDLLVRSGADVVTAAAPVALTLYDRVRPDVVVLDCAGDSSGVLEVLTSFVSQGAAVLALAEPGTVAAARALTLGAEQLLVTPVEPDQLAAAVDRVRARLHLRREHDWLRARRLGRGGLETLGPSAPMRTLARRIEQAARDGRVPLLLVGEVGTGKGWVARIVHELDPARHGPLIEIGSTGRTSATSETEVFGREAHPDDGEPRRVGLLEIADRGTAYVGEVGDLALDVQAQVASVLATGVLRRVGGTRDLPVDVRIIAGTAQDLPTAVRAGAFHSALFDRLGPHAIRLPPVRERSREDRLALVDRLMADLGRALPGAPSECTPEARERLISAPWPGNVRELRAVLERALLLARGGARLGVQHLPADLGDGRAFAADLAERETRPIPLAEVEREYIERALRYHHGNRTRAAHDLGISRATLINKIKVYALDL
jgi:two-component system, NtrC family, response regulator AtoC